MFFIKKRFLPKLAVIPLDTLGRGIEIKDLWDS